MTMKTLLCCLVAMLLSFAPPMADAKRARPQSAQIEADAPAPQRQVFHCRDAGGVPMYQDVPCPRGATHVRTLRMAEYVPPSSLVKAAQKRENKLISAWERASMSRLPASLGGTARAAPVTAPSRGPRAPTACDIARAERDRAYLERPNAIPFDERRAMLDQIGIACGGP
jgi:hypothetical protein